MERTRRIKGAFVLGAKLRRYFEQRHSWLHDRQLGISGKRKGRYPAAFGDFITLWLRQPDGKYKWVVDIGVGHPKPEKYSTEWTTFTGGGKKDNSKPTSDAATEFYQLAAAKGVAKAYEKLADDNIRSYREDKYPVLGKKSVIKMLQSDKAEYSFAKRSSTFSSDDISYNLNTYTKTKAARWSKKEIFCRSGNFTAENGILSWTYSNRFRNFRSFFCDSHSTKYNH